MFIHICKLADRSRERPKGLLFNTYNTEIYKSMQLLSPDCSIYPRSLPYNSECRARRPQVQFLSLWYDSTRDWTLVFRTTGEHSNDYANGSVYKEISHMICKRIVCNRHNFKNKQELNCLYTVKLFQVLLFDICIQLNGLKYCNLYTVKWFEVLQFGTNNFILY